MTAKKWGKTPKEFDLLNYTEKVEMLAYEELDWEYRQALLKELNPESPHYELAQLLLILNGY